MRGLGLVLNEARYKFVPCLGGLGYVKYSHRDAEFRTLYSHLPPVSAAHSLGPPSHTVHS